jgi:hypothetical protein
MQVGGSDEQPRNADIAICGSLASLSNLTFDKVSHPLKASSQMIRTEEGIHIDESDEQFSNADSSIRESPDSLSKLTFDRVLH